MQDYTKALPEHEQRYLGENDLFLEVFEGDERARSAGHKPPLLFVHGAYTGSTIWSKYIPHFMAKGWRCYVMNLRGHYKSRAQDMTRITFADYLEDTREVMAECGEPPVLIGFSMGGILCQKVAETAAPAGLVLIDSSISREVYARAPYPDPIDFGREIIIPAPARPEQSSIDESPEDIVFQRKYLTMESARALGEIYSHAAGGGISIDSGSIACPCLIIKAVNSDLGERQGSSTAITRAFRTSLTPVCWWDSDTWRWWIACWSGWRDSRRPRPFHTPWVGTWRSSPDQTG